MATRGDQQEVVLDVDGMTCASCVRKIESALGRVEGVDEAVVNLATRTATVRTAAEPHEDELITAVRSAGYGARPHTSERSPDEEYHSYLRRFVVAAVLTVPVLAVSFVLTDLSWAPETAWLLTTPVVFWALSM